MAEQTPATPAPAATPGSNGQTPAKPSAAVAPTTPKGEGGQPEEGKVTISTKEFSELQRSKARLQSIQKRIDLAKRKPGKNPSEGGDSSTEGVPEEILTELDTLREKTAKDEVTILRFQVKEGVEKIFGKPEYAKLPKSVKDLIMKNPSALSEADNVDEALIDIEDFIIDQVAGLSPEQSSQPQNAPGAGQAPNPPGHETPRPAGTGAAAPGPVSDDEDVSQLRGSARSRAILRNKVREKARGESK